MQTSSGTAASNRSASQVARFLSSGNRCLYSMMKEVEEKEKMGDWVHEFLCISRCDQRECSPHHITAEQTARSNAHLTKHTKLMGIPNVVKRALVR